MPLGIAVVILMVTAVVILMVTAVVILLGIAADMTLEKRLGVRVCSHLAMEFGTIWCHGVPITAGSKAGITLPGLIVKNQY